MVPAAETLEDSARRIGHHAWVEQRLFETLGTWVPTTPEPEAKALVAEQSLHHAWRAELWHGLLPVVPHLAVDDLVVAPPGAPAPPAGDTTADRLGWLCGEVLPALLDGYAEHLARTTVVTDGPTIRVLGLVTADARADLAAGRALLSRLGPGRPPRL